MKKLNCSNYTLFHSTCQRLLRLQSYEKIDYLNLVLVQIIKIAIMSYNTEITFLEKEIENILLADVKANPETAQQINLKFACEQCTFMAMAFLRPVGYLYFSKTSGMTSPFNALFVGHFVMKFHEREFQPMYVTMLQQFLNFTTDYRFTYRSCEYRDGEIHIMIKCVRRGDHDNSNEITLKWIYKQKNFVDDMRERFLQSSNKSVV